MEKQGTRMIVFREKINMRKLFLTYTTIRRGKKSASRISPRSAAKTHSLIQRKIRLTVTPSPSLNQMQHHD